MKKLANTLVILGVISLGTLPAQAVNEQLTLKQNIKSQSGQEKIEEAINPAICIWVPEGLWCF